MVLSMVHDKCPDCGSDDLAHFAMQFTGIIGPGVKAFIGCRHCEDWWELVSIAPAQNVFEPDKWRVVRAGRGCYSSPEEKAQATAYIDADYQPQSHGGN